MKTKTSLCSCGSCSSRAFTLVELLVVMTIVIVLGSLSVTGMRSLTTSLGLSSATQALISELTTARQTALSLDETVQVRFYQFPDSTGVTPTKEYQAIQSFRTKDGLTYTPLDKVVYLPPNIMISPNTTYSSPLGSTTATNAATTDPTLMVNGIGNNYSYVGVNFKSNGTIDPQVSAWFVTLYEKKYGTTGTPVNFTTVSVDPQNGRLRLFQP